MAKCDFCKREMTTAAGCIADRLIFKPNEGGKGKVFSRIANGQEQRYGGINLEHFTVPTRARCHDCGVLGGKFHHPGCDWEECPRCKHQLISCSCNDEGVFSDVHERATVDDGEQESVCKEDE